MSAAGRRPWPGAAVLAALAACGPEPVVIAPVIETPTPGEPGSAFPDLDELELSLGRVGSTEDLLTATFHRGDVIELTGVPDGDGLVLHVTGRLGGGDAAYGRSCPFSIHAGEPAPDLRIYFAQIVHWAARATPPTAVRLGGQAVVDHDGRLVLVGGVDAPGAAVTALDAFDPSTGAFEQAARVMAREGGEAVHVGVAGSDGVAVFGGVDPATGLPSPVLERIELDASADRRVEQLDRPLLARVGAAVAALSDGRVLVAGGRPVAGPPLAGTAELVPAGSAVREYSATLAVPRVGATATLLSDDLGAPVLIAGGLDRDGAPVALAELWKPLAETFADPGTFAPRMVVPRSGHAAARMPDGTVLIIGGVDGLGRPVRELERFSFDVGFVLARTAAGAPALLPPGTGVLDRAVTTLADGRLLVTGGREVAGGPALASAALVSLNTLDDSVAIITTAPMLAPRAGHAAGLLCDGTVLVTGGSVEPVPAVRYVPGRERR